MKPEEFLQREEEVGRATREFPDMEMGAAYTRWKAIRGEVATMLQSSDESIEQAKKSIAETIKKPCTQENCTGTMILESVCSGCVEGKKGYRSKWTCQECLHRELNKKDYLECLKELSSPLKASFSPSV